MMDSPVLASLVRADVRPSVRPLWGPGRREGTHCEEPSGSHEGINHGGKKHQGEAREQETCEERAGSEAWPWPTRGVPPTQCREPPAPVGVPPPAPLTSQVEEAAAPGIQGTQREAGEDGGGAQEGGGDDARREERG